MEELLALKNQSPLQNTELENSIGKKISNINSSLVRNINTLQAALLTNDKSTLDKLNVIIEVMGKLSNSKESLNILESLSNIKNEMLIPNFMKITDTIADVLVLITQSNKETTKNLFGITSTLNNNFAKVVSKINESIASSANKITQLLDFENQNQLLSNHVSNILKNIKLAHDHIISLPAKTDLNKILQSTNLLSKSLSSIPVQIFQSLEKIIVPQITEVQNQLTPVLPAIPNIFDSKNFTSLQEDIKMSLSSLANVNTILLSMN
jgi:hypothetical protein